jgi:hypothetical protein
VQLCANSSATRGPDRPESARQKESRPRFTEVGCRLPSFFGASGACGRKAVEVQILSSAPAFARDAVFDTLRSPAPLAARRSPVVFDYRRQRMISAAAGPLLVHIRRTRRVRSYCDALRRIIERPSGVGLPLA